MRLTINDMVEMIHANHAWCRPEWPAMLAETPGRLLIVTLPVEPPKDDESK